MLFVVVYYNKFVKFFEILEGMKLNFEWSRSTALYFWPHLQNRVRAWVRDSYIKLHGKNRGNVGERKRHG